MNRSTKSDDNIIEIISNKTYNQDSPIFHSDFNRNPYEPDRDLEFYFSNNDSNELLDIYELYRFYNKFFFHNILDASHVKWSERMTLCAGTCKLDNIGSCTITLSKPLLQFRSNNNIKETLLHEMIHGYLFITNPKAGLDHDGHGPAFLEKMAEISQITGLNITVYHNFHDEVDFFRKHIWKCNGPCQHLPPYYGLVKRAQNRPPSERDWWWKKHAETCNGTYAKIAGPDIDENGQVIVKEKTKKRKRENESMLKFLKKPKSNQDEQVQSDGLGNSKTVNIGNLDIKRKKTKGNDKSPELEDNIPRVRLYLIDPTENLKDGNKKEKEKCENVFGSDVDLDYQNMEDFCFSDSKRVTYGTEQNDRLMPSQVIANRNDNEIFNFDQDCSIDEEQINQKDTQIFKDNIIQEEKSKQFLADFTSANKNLEQKETNVKASNCNIKQRQQTATKSEPNSSMDLSTIIDLDELIGDPPKDNKNSLLVNNPNGTTIFKDTTLGRLNIGHSSLNFLNQKELFSDDSSSLSCPLTFESPLEDRVLCLYIKSKPFIHRPQFWIRILVNIDITLTSLEALLDKIIPSTKKLEQNPSFESEIKFRDLGSNEGDIIDLDDLEIIVEKKFFLIEKSSEFTKAANLSTITTTNATCHICSKKTHSHKPHGLLDLDNEFEYTKPDCKNMLNEKIKMAIKKPVCIGACLLDQNDSNFENYISKGVRFNPEYLNNILEFFDFY